MIFLPYERFSFQTKSTPDQVRQKLSSELETSLLSSWSSITTKKTFRGKVEENKFEIVLIGLFGNSFTPVMKGDISYEIEHTHISVRMLPRFYLAIFMILSLGFLGLIFFALLAAWIFSVGTFEVSPAQAILPVGGMFILVYSFLVGGFKVESFRSKKRLRAFLGAIEEQR